MLRHVISYICAYIFLYWVLIYIRFFVFLFWFYDIFVSFLFLWHDGKSELVHFYIGFVLYQIFVFFSGL